MFWKESRVELKEDNIDERYREGKEILDWGRGRRNKIKEVKKGEWRYWIDGVKYRKSCILKGCKRI